MRDGAAILAFLMPVFVDVMMDHPGEDRGPSLLSGRGIEACSDGLGVLSRFGSGPEDRAQAWNRAGPARARLKSPAALEQALWSPRRRRERAPLPTRPPELAVWARVKLHPDCHVQFEKTYYSAAFPLVRQRLWLRATETTVRLFRDHELVATHPRQFRPGGPSTIDEHLPPEAIVYKRRDPQWCLRQSEDIGAACHVLNERLFAHRVLDNLRAAESVIGLARRFGTQRLETPCQRALNRLLGAATLDRLRHGAYRLTLEGESYRSPRPMPEPRKPTVATGGRTRK